MARRGPTILDTVLDVIRSRGPMSVDALAQEIVAAGRTQAKDPRRAVSAAIGSSRRLAQAWDGRWCSLTEQLEGAVFTTSITGLERRDEIVLVRQELALVGRIVPWSHEAGRRGDIGVHIDFLSDYFDLPYPTDELETADLREVLGDEVADALVGFAHELGVPPDADEQATLGEFLWDTRDARILHGPTGWLPPLGPRQLLGLRVRAGRVETTAFDKGEVTGIHVGLAGAKVARLAQLVLGPDPSWFGPPVIEIEDLLELVATEAAEILRRPLPPFHEVVRRGGLEVRDGLVGHPGTDWDALGLGTPSHPGEPWGFEPSRRVH